MSVHLAPYRISVRTKIFRRLLSSQHHTRPSVASKMRIPCKTRSEFDEHDDDTASTASTAVDSVEKAKAEIAQRRPDPAIQFTLTLSSALRALSDEMSSWKELTVYNPTRRAIAVKWDGSAFSFPPACYDTDTFHKDLEKDGSDPTKYVCTFGCYVLQIPRFPPLRHYYRYRGVDFDVIRPGCTRSVYLRSGSSPYPILKGCKKILVAWREFKVKLEPDVKVEDWKDEMLSRERIRSEGHVCERS